jgi:hypothetical protein
MIVGYYRGIALLVFSSMLAACRGGDTRGLGAPCDDSQPCRSHYWCNLGACIPEANPDLDELHDAGPSDRRPDLEAERDDGRNDPPSDLGVAPGDGPDDPMRDFVEVPSVTCAPDCRADETCCIDRCVDLSLDPRNCGACGLRCSGPRATEACAVGKCIVAKCDTGWADCNSDPVDGCEASLLDLSTCGACDQSCKVLNGSSTCELGRCMPVKCDKGFLAQDGLCQACARPVVALCGRGTDGIVCARSNTDGTLAAPILYTTDFNDNGGWADLPHYSTIHFPDVNGDGQADVCGRHSDGVFCGLGVGASRFAPASQWTGAFEDPFWGTSAARYMSLQFPDVNGDGKSDLCGGDLFCMPSNGSRFIDIQVWTTDFAAAEPNWDVDASYWGTLQFPDVDGDGRDDVCARMPDGIRCGEANTDFFDAIRKWSDGVYFYDVSLWTDPTLAQTIQFPDVDGDGKADVCSRTPTSVLCQRSLSIGSFGNTFELKEFGDPQPDQRPPLSVWATIQFPDINGDGKADVCGRKADGLWCAQSTGDGFLPLSLASAEFSDSKGFQDPLYSGSIQFADLDGDGADDVCGRRMDGVLCAFSDGGGRFVRAATLSAFTDAEGWAKPESASTLTLLYLTRDTRRGCTPRLTTPFPRAAARLLR